jgi:exosortase
MAQQQRISIVAFFLGLYGLTGMAWGPGWLRASFFPFFLFAFTIPMAEVADVVTFPLRMLVTTITVDVCKCIGLDVIRDGTQIFDAQHTFAYDVAPACSGIRSLTALLGLTTVLGFMTYRSAWKRAAMVFAAVPLAVAGNVMRLLFIIVTAETFGQEAGDYIHDSAWLSLLPYVPMFAAWIWLQRRYHEEGKDGA